MTVCAIVIDVAPLLLRVAGGLKVCCRVQDKYIGLASFVFHIGQRLGLA